VAAILASLALGLPAAVSAAAFRPTPVSRIVQSAPALPHAATTGPVAGHGTLKPKDAPNTPTTNTANTTPPGPPASKNGPGGAGMMIDPNG